MRLFFSQRQSLVKLFVVGKGMRIGTRDPRMHERGSLSRPAIFRCALKNRVARKGIAAVALLQKKPGIIGH